MTLESDFKDKIRVTKVTIFDIKLVGKDVIQGLIYNLKGTFREAYPDGDKIDQVHPNDGIFWGNVPRSLWWFYDKLVEISDQK